MALITLGGGVAASAIVGPLALGAVKFHVSTTMETQLLGGEIVSLFIVAPLGILTGFMWMRSAPRAPILALGPALYSVYMYPQFVVGPQYERYPGNNEYLFPLYLALTLLGWLISVRAWAELRTRETQILHNGVRRILGVLLIALNAIIGLTWISSVITVVADPAAHTEYQSDQTLFWIIRLMDLGFVIPAGLIVGGGLLLRRAWADRLALAFTGFQTLIVAAVAAMALLMAIRRDPAANAVLLAVTGTMTFAFAFIYARLLRANGASAGATPS
jgi:hypothetical protein